ncbi:MAG: response regulator [Jatrophihabitantaceae bacterium]
MRTPSRRAKVLLVDDRTDNLLALEAILQALDQELVRAESGEMALKRLLTDTFAVVLLDVQMPGMDGFETAERIKRREKTRDTPIIFMTAGTGESHQTMRGYATGAVDYLAKPFDPWVLRAKVAFFVDLFLRERATADRIASLTRTVETLRGQECRSAVTAAQAALGTGNIALASRTLRDLDNLLGGGA